MKIIERIHVATPIAKVATALETLLAEHGYACRTETRGNRLRLVVGDGRLAVDLIRRAEPKEVLTDRRPTSQQPFRVLGGLARKSRERLPRAASC